MKTDKLDVIGYVDVQLIEKAEKCQALKKKNTRVKWVALAACLCLAAAAAIYVNSLKPADFVAKIAAKTVDTVLIITTIPIGDRTAHYEQVQVQNDKLNQYMGSEYLSTDTATWYTADGFESLKYLIRKDSDESLTLWKFYAFETACTYGDILSVIYGVESADDIVSITTSPLKANNTDKGLAIQKSVGTHRYKNRSDIEEFYNIVRDVVCLGIERDHISDETRFSYSFSTGSADKLTSGESTYGTRCISLEIEDGTVLDSWKYSALSGSFFEYGGICTEPLRESDVYALNDIFGIK